MEEVLKDIYRVHLTDRPNDREGVAEINIYIVKGRSDVNDGRSLMVDAGFKYRPCLDALQKALSDLSIPMEHLDIFVTHLHHDHSGLARTFAELGARIFMNPEEERHPYDCFTFLKSSTSEEEQRKVLHYVGVSEELTPSVWERFMDSTSRVDIDGEGMLGLKGFPYTPAAVGDEYRYGIYHLKALQLRGHTYGQLGLCDEEKKIIFPADQVISGTSPIIVTSYPDESLLQGFFDSLDYIKHHCSGWKFLTAHGREITNISETVDKEVYSYLNKSTLLNDYLRESGRTVTAQEAADRIYQISWYPDRFSDFFQYKMKISKTFSILEYLYGLGFVSRTLKNGTFYWKSTEKVTHSITANA